jgi:uncharacterized NAD(P)/FAD-binding protein YdhS
MHDDTLPLLVAADLRRPVEQRAARAARQIVILGGGWSGAAVATHLLRHGPEGLEVVVVERGDTLGRGVAYGSDDARLLLNVPAGRMSLDPERRQDFLDWARATQGDVSEHDLVPRAWVGPYVSERLAEAVRGARARLRVVRGEATSMRRVDGRWRVEVASGVSLDADGVVLATGHGPARVPEALAGLRGDGRLVADPWAPGVVRGFAPDSRVLLVGTGLTALDVLRVLHDAGHRAPVVAVSRAGAWPRPHRPDGEAGLPPWSLDLAAAPSTADGLAAWFGEALEAARVADVPWQAVLVAVRPHITTLWSRLPVAEQARFLTTYRSRWEVLRHRAPHAAWAELRVWHREGWVRTVAGGVHGVAATPEALHVATADGVNAYDHVVLCTGAETDPRAFRGPLWESLREGGTVVPDALGLGVVTAEGNVVVGVAGPHPDVWTVGGLQRPRLYETTSVPDLAGQALAVARAALARVGPEPVA